MFVSHKSSTAVLLWTYVSPVLFVVGAGGNLLIIVVLTRSKTRESSTAVYLTALACADLTVILTGLTRWWIIYVCQIDVRVLNHVSCAVHYFFIFVSTQISSLLLVALTIERIISTRVPHKFKVLCTQKSALITVTLIIIGISCLNSHLLFGMGIRSTSSGSAGTNGSDTHAVSNDSLTTKLTCGPRASLTEYSYFFYYIYQWIDMILYFAIPMVILSVGVFLIIHRLSSSEKKFRRAKHTVSTGRASLSRHTSITVMLLTVNCVFIICVTPICVFLIGKPYWVDNKKGFDETQEAWWTIVNLLMYLNHSVNFCLYFLSGSRFRKKVVELFRLPTAPRRERIHAHEVTSRTNSKQDMELVSVRSNKTEYEYI